MRVADVLGLVGGAVFAAVGIFYAPSPAYDPGGWGYCGIGAVYPVRLPDETPLYGLDIYTCVVDPKGVAILLIYLVAVFLFSGAVASRVGEEVKPVQAAVVIALVIVPAILMMVFPYDRLVVIPTTLIGISVVLGAIALAYLGGYLAKRNA